MICEDVAQWGGMRAREWDIMPWRPLWGHVLVGSSRKCLYSALNACLCTGNLRITLPRNTGQEYRL